MGHTEQRKNNGAPINAQHDGNNPIYTNTITSQQFTLFPNTNVCNLEKSKNIKSLKIDKDTLSI